MYLASISSNYFRILFWKITDTENHRQNQGQEDTQGPSAERRCPHGLSTTLPADCLRQPRARHTSRAGAQLRGRSARQIRLRCDCARERISFPWEQGQQSIWPVSSNTSSHKAKDPVEAGCLVSLQLPCWARDAAVPLNPKTTQKQQ